MEFDISDSMERFDKHIEPDDNDRIIFSGKFGAGKTFFLKKFFDENGGKYCNVHLFPINYTAASNEDIFELIKFDILFHLLETVPIEEDESLTHQIFLYFFLQNRATDILGSLLGLIPKIGPVLASGAGKLIALANDYQEAFEEENKSKKELLEKYLTSIKDKKGNIYEEDLITNIIRDLIEKITSEGKKVVLIIDDLDRIDPGHLFRILNVLSAHTDRHENGDNKFGFDKIILTFHLENVKHIYHHQYGYRTDFEGYIDKFYTSIFPYHLTEGLMNRVSDVLMSIEHTKNPNRKLFQGKNSRNVINTSYILSSLIDSTELTVRNILKLYNRVYDIPKHQMDTNELIINGSNSMTLFIVEVLLEIYGNLKKLEKAIESADFLGMENTKKHSLMEFLIYCIPIADKNFHAHIIDYTREYNLTVDEYGVDIKYTIPRERRYGIFAKEKSITMGEHTFDGLHNIPDNEFIILYKALLIESVRGIEQKGLLVNR